MKLTAAQLRLLTESAENAVCEPAGGRAILDWHRVTRSLELKGLGCVYKMRAENRYFFKISEAGQRLLRRCHPECPGYLHMLTDEYGLEIQRCDECHAAGVGCETDEDAQDAHDKVCPCHLNDRTRRKLSTRQAPRVWLLPSQDEWGDTQVRVVRF